jgi:hypothetical protein
MISVQGTIVKPEHSGRHAVAHDGKPFMLPGTGGITYNVKVGDPVFGWAADHVEPGVSTILDHEKRDSGPNRGYNFYACVGTKLESSAEMQRVPRESSRDIMGARNTS